MKILNCFLGSILLNLSLFSAHSQEYVEIYGGSSFGYDAAYCPSGYQLQSCRFDYWSCDRTHQGSNYCAAEPKDNRSCRFNGTCRRTSPDRTYIYGGRAGGEDTQWCPGNMRIERCEFDLTNCEHTQEGYNFCKASSRENRHCTFRGTCLGY